MHRGRAEGTEARVSSSTSPGARKCKRGKRCFPLRNSSRGTGEERPEPGLRPASPASSMVAPSTKRRCTAGRSAPPSATLMCGMVITIIRPSRSTPTAVFRRPVPCSASRRKRDGEGSATEFLRARSKADDLFKAMAGAKRRRRDTGRRPLRGGEPRARRGLRSEGGRYMITPNAGPGRCQPTHQLAIRPMQAVIELGAVADVLHTALNAAPRQSSWRAR